MKFTPETASNILNALVEISPEFADIIDMAAVRCDERAKLKNELLQRERNIADDISGVESAIKTIDGNIANLTSQLNAARGQRLSAFKKLAALRRENEDVCKEWIRNGFCTGTNS